MSLSRFWPESNELDGLIAAARGGSHEALGTLLERCRDYLLLVAGREIGRDLQGKIGASDLVQETFVRRNRCLEALTELARRSFWAGCEKCCSTGCCSYGGTTAGRRSATSRGRFRVPEIARCRRPPKECRPAAILQPLA